jgi:small-conductance mechanosensitive channel
MKSITIYLFYLFIGLATLLKAPAFAQDSLQNKGITKESTIKDSTDFSNTNIESYNEAYFILERQNEIFDPTEITVNRSTPQATLENFILSARNDDYLQAAKSFNFNLLPSSTTKEQVAILAQKLYTVINQNLNIDWDKIPDRPDGQLDIALQTNNALVGEPRRSIAFGRLKINDRTIDLRLQRVKYRNESPFWLISSNTVDNIDALYSKYGTRQISKNLPGWAVDETFLNIAIWKYLATIIALLLSIVLGWLTMFILKRVFGQSSIVWISSTSFRLALPASLFVGTLLFYVLLNNFISFNGDFANSFYKLLLILAVIFGTWFFMRFADAFLSFIAKNSTEDIYTEKSLKERRILTHLSVGRRIVTSIVVLIGASIILSQFEAFKNLGISLFASAGVATIIVGIAAQSTLGNIIAGIQIAVTKPAQVGDIVIFSGQWGQVEDIGFVFMVVKTWDKRRIVIPLKSVISESFENWSMRGASQIRSIDIYTDYRIDVEKVRQKYKTLIEASDKWDKEKEPTVQVVESTDKAIKIRALCSAKDPFTAWDLQCELREQLIAYICELEGGLGLTKWRVKTEKE